MLKEDGRLEPADPKEIAAIKGKKYMCSNCGLVNVFEHTEFADELKCSGCGHILNEEHASTGRA
jgi:rubredoxin